MASRGRHFSFSVIPETPLVGESSRIHVMRAASECSEPLPGMIGMTEIDDHAIRYEIDVSDTCQPRPAEGIDLRCGRIGCGAICFRFLDLPPPGVAARTGSLRQDRSTEHRHPRRQQRQCCFPRNPGLWHCGHRAFGLRYRVERARVDAMQVAVLRKPSLSPLPPHAVPRIMRRLWRALDALAAMLR